MMQYKTFVPTGLTFLTMLLGPGAALAQEHGEDVVVGRNAAGQLAAEVPVPGPHELLPVATLIHGWAGDEPGFLNLESDEPDEDFFVLSSGAIINLELVSIDGALKVWSPGFGVVLTTPGQSFVVGGSEFDVHPTVHIDSTDPGFDPETLSYSATFRLFDSGTTGYGPSEPFTLSFTPVPEPATAFLIGLSVSVWAARHGRSARRARRIQ